MDWTASQLGFVLMVVGPSFVVHKPLRMSLLLVDVAIPEEQVQMDSEGWPIPYTLSSLLGLLSL